MLVISGSDSGDEYRSELRCDAVSTAIYTYFQTLRKSFRSPYLRF